MAGFLPPGAGRRRLSETLEADSPLIGKSVSRRTILGEGPTLAEQNIASLREFAIVPGIQDKLVELEGLAEAEEWNYKHTETTFERPILYNYLQRNFARLSEQGRIEESPDGEHVCLNTGLVTVHQEPIFMLFDRNLKYGQEDQPPWHFRHFCRRGEHQLNYFEKLPEMATYFEDPSCLVLDPRLELRVNVEHIIADNKERFSSPYNERSDFELQMLLNGAIDNARERVRRNYKAAVPQFYQGRVQLLLPLCLTAPENADMAIVVERFEGFYRGSTCLTLDMAYNNARQLARPDRDWLQP